MRSPALVLKPVKPASKTISQSVPKMNLVERYSCRDVEVAQRRRLHAKTLAELVVSLIAKSNRVLREEVGTNLKLELKLALGVVGRCRVSVFRRWAFETVPKLSINFVGASPVQGREDRYQAREGTRRVDKVFINRAGRLKLGDKCVIRDMRNSTL